MVPGTIKRMPEMINDVEFNCLLANCRSLKNKIPSLLTNIEINRSTCALLTETWFQRGDRQLKKKLEEVSLEHGVQFIRKDRDKRGGGVAIAYNSNNSEFKKLQLELSLIHI